MPNEHPILFSAPMARAILAGTKTQTRRVIGVEKLEFVGDERILKWSDLAPEQQKNVVGHMRCKFGGVKDRLWVRETFALETWTHEFGDKPPIPPGKPSHKCEEYELGDVWEWPHYRATDETPELCYEDAEEPTCRWQPSIHMPRWASRITLEITDVRVERLQDIWEKSHSFDECLREGIPQETAWDGVGTIPTPLSLFIHLWDSINAKRGYGWDANPFVWCVSFKVVKP